MSRTVQDVYKRQGISSTSLIFAKLMRTLLPSFTGLIFAIGSITPVLCIHAGPAGGRPPVPGKNHGGWNSPADKGNKYLKTCQQILANCRMLCYTKSIPRHISP